MGKIINIEKVFKSEKSTITKIEPILVNLKKDLEIKDDKFYNIMIAVTEAVNNAISHGNNFSPDKNVTFKVVAKDDILEIIVIDEGDGFEPEEVKDCLQPENLLKDNGRGVFIIGELMDNIAYDTSNGTKLTMTYNLK